MDAGRPSQTALGVAGARAIHLLYDGIPKIFADPLGTRLVEQAAPDTFARQCSHRQEPVAMYIRSHMVLRSRFAEDLLAEAVAQGVRQYVILGAGLDTFAFRRPPFARDLRIFEVDHPATQAWKRGLLAALSLLAPDNLFWAPVDFERDPLAGGLTAAGFDAAQPAYISWLGVTMYLTPAAVDAVLAFVAALPPPSTITLDFRLPEAGLTGLDRETAQFVTQLVARQGEPSTGRYTAEEIRAHLGDLGFPRVFHLTPAEAERRYFGGRHDGLRAPRLWQLVAASV